MQFSREEWDRLSAHDQRIYIEGLLDEFTGDEGSGGGNAPKGARDGATATAFEYANAGAIVRRVTQ